LDPKGVLPVLKHGYYVFEIEAPGYASMNVPIHLNFEMVKQALEKERGKPISFDLEMVPAHRVPKDMRVFHRTRGYIGHNFHWDGDTASANSFPWQTIEIPTQAVSKDPISVREYKAFIEDLLLENQRKNQFKGRLLRGGLEEIEALLPRTTVPAEARGKQRKLTGMVQRALGGQETTFYWHLIRERALLGLGPTRRAYLLDPTTHEDPFGEPIHRDHPISAISPESGMVFVEWRAEKDGLPFEMLDANTKQVIACSSFDIRYPWGNGDMTDAYLVTHGSFEDPSRATPQIIGTHPMGQENYRDWSWYGIRELYGNVREITSTPGEPDHFCLSGGCVRMYTGTNFNPDARYQTHRKAVVDSDGTFRLKLPFPKEK
jgi:formylglycine-generating enzyme required for sulfatase activity